MELGDTGLEIWGHWGDSEWRGSMAPSWGWKQEWLWIEAEPHAAPSWPAEVLRKGSRTLIYLWDSGKGRGSLGEVLKPRSGVSSVSVIYLEWEKASDRRKKIMLRGGGADPFPWLGVAG